jgi:hypothetical protein
MKKFFLTFFVLITSWMLSFGQSSPWPPVSPAPDSYGYTWKTDSASDGPSFNWIDITGVGTQVQGLADDNFVGPFPMGIDFPYYWLTKNELWIGSNGFLSFQPANISSTMIGFPPPPTADGNEDIIAPFMSDLSFAGSMNPGQAWYYSDQAENRFIVSFLDVPFWTNNAVGYAGSNSFQVILDADDSTITYQYLEFTGNWNSSYDNTDNPFVVGIEAITGNIGLSVPEPPVNTAKKPRDSTAITFFAPSTPGPVIDAAVSKVQNDESKGAFFPFETTVSGEIRNQGSADITDDIFVEAAVFDTMGTFFFFATDTITGGLTTGQSQALDFTSPLFTPFENPYRVEIKITNAAAFGDVNPSNNVAEAEVVAIDTSLEEIFLDYVSDDINNALGSPAINWTGNTGNSGAAVFFNPPGDTVELLGLEFRHLFIQTDTLRDGYAYSVHSHDASGALPGPLLATDTLPLDSIPTTTGGWARVNFDSPIMVDSNGFYVAWYQQDPGIVLGTEEKAPISRQTYEILDGDWSVYRSVNVLDIWIRAIVSIEYAVDTTSNDTTGNDTSTSVRALLDVNKFDVYPNPTNGLVHIDIKLDQPADLMIKVINMEGKKVWLGVRPKTDAWQEEVDLSDLGPGVYLIQILTPEGQKTKRLIKR